MSSPSSSSTAQHEASEASQSKNNDSSEHGNQLPDVQWGTNAHSVVCKDDPFTDNSANYSSSNNNNKIAHQLLHSDEPIYDSMHAFPKNGYSDNNNTNNYKTDERANDTSRESNIPTTAHNVNEIIADHDHYTHVSNKDNEMANMSYTSNKTNTRKPFNHEQEQTDNPDVDVVIANEHEPFMSDDGNNKNNNNTKNNNNNNNYDDDREEE